MIRIIVILTPFSGVKLSLHGVKITSLYILQLRSHFNSFRGVIIAPHGVELEISNQLE